MSTTTLSIHGICVEVNSEFEAIHTWLRFDFHLFVTETSGRADLNIAVVLGKIPYESVPNLVEKMHGPQYVCFDSESHRYVDYFGKALAIFDYRKESGTLYSEDAEFCYEKLYLLIQSRAGEMLDRRGIHRVHALGVSIHGKAALFLIPMRGGKSTLALRLLATPNIRLLSDDTPLVTKDGMILPFPVRLGVMLGEEPKDIPPKFLRVFQRDQFGPKSLIDVACFADKIEQQPCPAALLFHGKWTFSAQPELVEISRWAGLRVLFRDCIVGLGLPQVVEFFLRSTWSDVLPKFLLVVRRTRAAFAVARKSRVYELRLCRDHARNTAFIVEKLQSLMAGGA